MQTDRRKIFERVWLETGLIWTTRGKLMAHVIRKDGAILPYYFR